MGKRRRSSTSSLSLYKSNVNCQLYASAALPRRKEPRHTLDRRLGVLQNQSVRLGEENNPALLGIEPWRRYLVIMGSVGAFLIKCLVGRSWSIHLRARVCVDTCAVVQFSWHCNSGGCHLLVPLISCSNNTNMDIDFDCLGCDDVWSCRWLPVFTWNVG